MGFFTWPAKVVFAETDLNNVPRAPDVGQTRTWAEEIELVATAGAVSGGALIFDTVASLNAALGHASNTIAWVISDTTPGARGIYRKFGATGVGSWIRDGDLFYQVIPLIVTGGTANAITASSVYEPPSSTQSAIFFITPTQTNTGPMTISVNGAAALPFRDSTGGEFPAGVIASGYPQMVFRFEGEYRTTNNTNFIAAQNSIAASLLSFNAAYLGQKSTVPTLDNAGNAIVDGAIYDLIGQTPATLNGLYVRRGGTWVLASSAPSAFRSTGSATVATDGQTVITVPGGYSVGQIDILRNGVDQQPGSDVTASDSATLVFPANTLQAGDLIAWRTYISFNVGSQPASSVTFSPAGDVSATTVQAAITELDTEKANAADAVTPAQLAAAVAGLDGSSSPFRINTSVVGGALTIEIKTIANADATPSVPLSFLFRDPTPANGGRIKRTLTTALSLVVPSAASLGVLANNAAFGLRLVLFYDGSAFKLGIVNCRSDGATKFILPLRPDTFAASTAISAAATSPGVFYTTAAVTSAPYLVLATLDYDSGLAAAGTWSVAPTRITPYAAGQPLPGDVLQTVYANSAAGSANGTTTYAIPTGASLVIAPSRPQNAVRVRCSASATIAATSTAVNPAHQSTLFRNAVDLGTTRSMGLASGAGGINQTLFGSVAMEALDYPLSAAAQTYSYQHKTSQSGINATSAAISLFLDEVCGS